MKTCVLQAIQRQLLVQGGQFRQESMYGLSIMVRTTGMTILWATCVNLSKLARTDIADGQYVTKEVSNKTLHKTRQILK